MSDTAKIVDKRVYKGTFPTCHDFNKEDTSPSCLLLIGFSAGQIQLIDPQQKELPNSKLFNEERQIDRTAVTCLQWIPDGRNVFVASHASGNLYVSFF
jgi:WD repeat-containing protein 20